MIQEGLGPWISEEGRENTGQRNKGTVVMVLGLIEEGARVTEGEVL